ncbi:MAG: hypothetical protein ACNYPD_01065 [Candidatus Halichondribacter symbioticus]
MLPRSGGYAQKTTLVGIRVAMTKTRKGFLSGRFNCPCGLKN